MDMIFPSHLQDFAEVKSIEEATNKITLENVSLSSNIIYRWVLQKGKYLYGRCKYHRCRALLTYKMLDQTFRLVKSEVAHNHSAQGSKKNLFSSIQSQLKELPTTISIQTAKTLICRKFSISTSTFYYLFRKIKHQKISVWRLTTMLVEKKCDVHSQPYEYGMDKLPNIMIIVSPLMKENFQRFGDWIGFDLTYNLIQEQTEEGRKWGLGVFTGISSSKKIVPFGLVLTNEETSKAYYQIFKSFSQIMNRLPQVIISDQDKAIIAAIKVLKQQRQFEGAHLLDCFHILRNVKKNLKNKNCWAFFNKLIRQQSKQRFQQIRMECAEAMQQEEDMNLLKRFVDNSQLYCLSQTPNLLYGFMPNTSMNQKTHDLIKRILPFSKPFTVVVQKVFQYLEDLSLKCHQYELETTKFEETFQYKPFKELRYLVCKQIFKQIVNQFSKSIYQTLIHEDEELFTVQENNAIYSIFKRENTWECECMFFRKSGILCSHLFKLALHLKLKVSDYVHKRWKIQPKEVENVKKKYAYQRKSRRNRK